MLSDYGSRVGLDRTDDGAVVAREHPHDGADIKAYAEGDPVLASADGWVEGITYDPEVGLEVMIAHPAYQRWTRYVHLRFAIVRTGERVLRGQQIGGVGLFWASGGVVHVHWMVCTTWTCSEPGPPTLAGTEDPMAYSLGCFEPGVRHPADRLRLTLPVVCD